MMDPYQQAYYDLSKE
uniref:Uncharacterized protein n=1 Tax=Romanomermis culicivorax TaxID=13658 RepID=A0A915IFS0_ROMCU